MPGRSPSALLVVCMCLFLASTSPASALAPVQVSGRVTDGAGIGVAGVQIQLLDTTQIVVGTAFTDGAGYYEMAIEPGTYSVRAIPAPGAGFLTAALGPRLIAGDTTIDVALVAITGVTLQGRILDGAGVPIAGVSLTLSLSGGMGSQQQTGLDGRYEFAVQSGSYSLSIIGSNPALEPNRPQNFNITIHTLPLETDRTLDIRLPVHRVDVHVQNAAGEAVADVGLSATAPWVNDCSATIEGLSACIQSTYFYSPPPPPMPGMPPLPQPVTDSAGNYSMWLFATPPPVPAIPSGYTISATPPSILGLPTTTIQNVVVAGDRELTITLAAATRLSGRILDGTGVPIAGASVSLSSVSGGIGPQQQTGLDGRYEFAVQSGSYSLSVFGSNPMLEPNRPQTFNITIYTLPLETDRTLDIQLPVHRIDVHVQNAAGEPVEGAGLGVTGPWAMNCSVTIAGLGACVQSTYFYSSPPPPLPGMPPVPQPVTDSAGNYSMWLFATPPPVPAMPSGYTISATPPSILGLPTTTIQNVEVAGDRQLTITLAAATRLSGRILDGAGVPIAGASVSLSSASGGMASQQTGLDGRYEFAVQSGTYSLSVFGGNPMLEPNRPQNFNINIYTLPLETDRTLDIQLPVHRVDVHVQNAAGEAVADIGLSATTPWGMNCSVPIGGFNACVQSTYYYVPPPPPPPGIPPMWSPQPVTDIAGNYTMWLFATPPAPPLPGPPPPTTTGYSITATPSPGGPFLTFNLPGLEVSGPTQLLIALHSVHPGPATVAYLDPAPEAGGVYADPVTVTLAATPFAGFVVDRIRYQLDDGPILEYTAPFVVTGDGSHTLRFWATDDLGAVEVPQALEFTIVSDRIAPDVSATVSPGANAYGWHNAPVLISLSANDNPGGSGVQHITYAVNDGSAVTVAGASAEIEISSEGVTTASFYAADGRGNTGPLQTITVRIDRTAPRIHVTAPVSAEYLHDAVLTPLWHVRDDVSPIISEAATFDGDPLAAGASVDLSSLPLGAHTFAVTATDAAGWTTSVSRTVTIIATIPSVQALLASGCAALRVAEGACVSLQAKLGAAFDSVGRGQVAAARGQLEAALHELRALRGAAVDESSYVLLSTDIAFVLSRLI